MFRRMAVLDRSSLARHFSAVPQRVELRRESLWLCAVGRVEVMAVLDRRQPPCVDLLDRV
jgi:hypothetical protein